MPTAKTLTIADTGIGMDRQELVDNLGTVARSGTKAFLKGLQDAKDGLGLIGQFGVGFIGLHGGRPHHRDQPPRRHARDLGMDLVGRRGLRAGAGHRAGGPRAAWHRDRPASEGRRGALPAAVRARAGDPYLLEHILFPIELLDDKGEARQVNAASALWQRSKSELKAEDYTQAYRSIAMAFDEPALTLHYKVEGRQAYAVLLFVPTTPPFDLADPGRKGRVKLYVRRVYITDDAELLPTWLRFVRGVVDSEDLPLNLSREMLQNNPQVTQIRNGLTSRMVGELESCGDQGARDLDQDLERLRRGPQGGTVRGPRAARPASGNGALRHDDRRGPVLAQGLRRRPQAQPDGDLLSRGRERRAS